MKCCHKCNAPKLTRQELILYSHLPETVNRLGNQLKEIGITWSEQHIRSILNRMEKKGIVESYRCEKGKVYDKTK